MHKLICLTIAGSLLCLTLGCASPSPGFNTQTCEKQYVLTGNSLIGGVCSGAERMWGLNRWICRVIFIITSGGAGAGTLVYLILWAAVSDCSTDCGSVSTVPQCNQKGIR